MAQQRSDSDTWQTWFAELQQHCQKLWGMDQDGGNVADPLMELVAAGWRMLEHTPTADQAPDELRRAIEGLRANMEQGSDSIQPVVQFARRILGLRHLATPTLAALAVTPDSPWPQLGPYQHEQALLERLDHSAGEYREALLRYADRIARMGEQALDQFEARLAESTDGLSRRQLLDEWADCAEAAYEQALEDDGHARDFAALTNSWAEFSLALQATTDRVAGGLGLPTREALDATQKHLDRLRRQHKQEINSLRAEMAALKQEVAAMRASTGAADDSD